MHRDEAEQDVLCASCGVAIDPELSGAFGFQDGYLCRGCAAERGGVYDSDLERWQVAPTTTGLEAPGP